jgi:hypothetical protein
LVGIAEVECVPEARINGIARLLLAALRLPD